MDSNRFIEILQDEYPNETAKLIEDIRKLKSKASEWISVKDRLPEVDKYGDVNVLCAFDDGFVATTTYDINNGWELWADAGEVTHWMPLPEPPKGELK